MNNLGVAYKNKKNLTEARSYYQSSMSSMSTAEVTFNMAVIDEKMAQYAEAAEKFNAVRNQAGALYNAGLCKLLMGDLAGAKTDLESSSRVDPNFALTYYVLAIVGARSSDTNLLVTNLKKAVSLDSKLADKAYKDLEFLKYKDNAEFKAALK
jgi:tetratricopeptide (TPR) repeat protein